MHYHRTFDLTPVRIFDMLAGFLYTITNNNWIKYLLSSFMHPPWTLKLISCNTDRPNKSGIEYKTSKSESLLFNYSAFNQLNRILMINKMISNMGYHLDWAPVNNKITCEVVRSKGNREHNGSNTPESAAFYRWKCAKPPTECPNHVTKSVIRRPQSL